MTIDGIYANGYHFGDQKFERGYVSRKTEIFEIHEAQGRRKGQFYINMPARGTSQYHVRQYLIPNKEEGKSYD